MSSASWALQQAIFARLSADATLMGLLGGGRIYDAVPQGGAFPYVVLSQSLARDWSTGTEAGEEHTLTLHVWSSAAGKKEAQQIMGAIAGALHDQALDLDGHRLVNLRHELSEARRDSSGETMHGIVRFRAVTEPA